MSETSERDIRIKTAQRLGEAWATIDQLNCVVRALVERVDSLNIGAAVATELEAARAALQEHSFISPRTG